MDTIIITALLVVFFGIMIGIGIYCRKHSTDVGGFVLGGRSIGPWLTALAFGTSYFSAVIFAGSVLATPLSARSSRGLCLVAARAL